MSNLIVPAPLWRRLLAALYDGLLLLGLWLATALLDVLIRESLLGLSQHTLWSQGLFFAVGLAFFGYSWTHGGQTLGMRAWRLRVRRLDGGALRWPVAALRYTVMLGTWTAVLMPVLLLIPRYATRVDLYPPAAGCALFALAAALLMGLEARRRAPCDWAAGTEVVELPHDVRET